MYYTGILLCYHAEMYHITISFYKTGAMRTHEDLLLRTAMSCLLMTTYKLSVMHQVHLDLWTCHKDTGHDWPGTMSV